VSIKTSIGIALALATLGLATERADNPKDRDEYRGVVIATELEGTWSVTSMVYNGGKNEVTEEWTFQGIQLIQSSNGKELGRGTFQAIPLKKLSEIDITSEASEGKPQKGVYRIEGDTLTICLDALMKDIRPTGFDAKKGSDHLLLVLKRVIP
jgi:uncharacterized protein (TIGR03067 family)